MPDNEMTEEKAVALINCATQLVRVANQIKRKQPGARDDAIQALTKLGDMAGHPAVGIESWSDEKLQHGCIAMAADLAMMTSCTTK